MYKKNECWFIRVKKSWEYKAFGRRKHNRGFWGGGHGPPSPFCKNISRSRKRSRKEATQISTKFFDPLMKRNNLIDQILYGIFATGYIIVTVRKRSLRRLCFYTCLSFCSQQGVSRPRSGGGDGGVCSGGCPGPGGVCPRGCPGPGGVQAQAWGVYPSMHWGRPPQQTATAADGTHPTGMHSCWRNYFYFLLFYCSCVL